MGCRGSTTKKELPSKDYDRRVVKRRRILAGVVVQKTPEGIEADTQFAYISEKDDTFKTKEIEADTRSLPALEYVSH